MQELSRVQSPSFPGEALTGCARVAVRPTTTAVEEMMHSGSFPWEMRFALSPRPFSSSPVAPTPSQMSYVLFISPSRSLRRAGAEANGGGSSLLSAAEQAEAKAARLDRARKDVDRANEEIRMLVSELRDSAFFYGCVHTHFALQHCGRTHFWASVQHNHSHDVTGRHSSTCTSACGRRSPSSIRGPMAPPSRCRRLATLFSARGTSRSRACKGRGDASGSLTGMSAASQLFSAKQELHTDASARTL